MYSSTTGPSISRSRTSSRTLAQARAGGGIDGEQFHFPKTAYRIAKEHDSSSLQVLYRQNSFFRVSARFQQIASEHAGQHPAADGRSHESAGLLYKDIADCSLCQFSLLIVEDHFVEAFGTSLG